VEVTEKVVRTAAARGVTGEYLITAEVPDGGVKTAKPGEAVSFATVFTAREAEAEKPALSVDQEERARRNRVDGWLSKLRLETPDNVLNTAFAFAKIRTT
jgi:hypothetical protein